MKEIVTFLNSIGIHVNISESSSPIYLFACVILLLSIITLICFIQILLYFSIIYVSDNKLLLDKLSKYPILLKIFNIYKQTRLVYLLFEVILLLLSLTSIIWFCVRIVYTLT